MRHESCWMEVFLADINNMSDEYYTTLDKFAAMQHTRFPSLPSFLRTKACAHPSNAQPSESDDGDDSQRPVRLKNTACLIWEVGTGAKPVRVSPRRLCDINLHDCALDRTLPNVDHVCTTPSVHDFPLQVCPHNRTRAHQPYPRLLQCLLGPRRRRRRCVVRAHAWCSPDDGGAEGLLEREVRGQL